jgi:hypothetical protein
MTPHGRSHSRVIYKVLSLESQQKVSNKRNHFSGVLKDVQKLTWETRIL